MHTKLSSSSPKMEFHVSRQARDRYKFDAEIFSISGNVIFANFHAARVRKEDGVRDKGRRFRR